MTNANETDIVEEQVDDIFYIDIELPFIFTAISIVINKRNKN